MIQLLLEKNEKNVAGTKLQRARDIQLSTGHATPTGFVRDRRIL
jgi:hypothetical protein